MKTRGAVILSLLVTCAHLAGAQTNMAIRWYVLSLGSCNAHSANRLIHGIVGQPVAETTRMGNLILNAGYLADPLFKNNPATVVATGTVPGEYELCQNYPNPFNPTTVVSGQSPVASHIRIVVYDILGRQVAVLMDEKHDAGKLQVVWDARNYASGVYICRMSAGNFVMSRKMVVAK
jgi:hypothetical protein